MTKQEKKVLEKCLEIIPQISTAGPSYDANFQQVHGGDPSDLFNDPRYRLGWDRCAANARMYLRMLLESKEDQIKFAGKAK